MIKNIFFLSIFLFLLVSSFFPAYSQVLNDSQILKPGNWIYDAMQDLSTESRKTIFLDTQPISVGELKFYLSKIDYNLLSESGKSLYSKVQKFLYTSNSIRFPNDSATKFALNAIVTPELYLKTNKKISSTMGRFFVDYPFTLPIMAGFSENYSKVK